MTAPHRAARAPRAEGYFLRVLRALGGRRLAAVVLVTLLMSLGSLLSATLLDFFSPAEIAIAWAGHLLELTVFAAALTIGFTLLDEALPPGLPLRLVLLCAALFAGSVLLTFLLYAYYGHGFEHAPPPLRVLTDSLRFGLPAVFLALIADLHRRALYVDAAAHAAENSRRQLDQDEVEQQLALLQAQIEPHFLFNVLGNVRRLCRVQPQAGAEMITSLMRYLRATLPQLRSRRGSLGDELEAVRAMLELFQVRMGARLSFSIDADATLLDAEFPPIVLLTLVENAIKHGLEPIGGGHVLVRARCRRRSLELVVLDDGAGFAGAAGDGSGVGLANVRRQLRARYEGRASLSLAMAEPRGACATVSIPLSRTAPPQSHRGGVAAA